MMPDFDAMTTAEIKHYLSEHRNDEQEFRSRSVALANRHYKVLMTRSTDAPKQPYPFDLANPEAEVTALLKQIIDLTTRRSKYQDYHNLHAEIDPQ